MTVESPLRREAHGGFGERPGETERRQRRHRAPGRLSLGVWCDNTPELLTVALRPGNAGSNTAADHIKVLDMALAGLPAHARPRPGEQPGRPGGSRLLARSDSAGATHAFAAACVARGVGFSFGFPVGTRIQGIVEAIPQQCWHPAIQTDGDLREGAWVAFADVRDAGLDPPG